MRWKKEIYPTNVCRKFQERFLNRDAEGGREAADELVRNIKRYIDSLQINVETTDIMTRAYANMSGLQTACVQNKKMKLGASMKLFAQGFTQRRALFDFVDVGPGKEQADNKIRGLPFSVFGNYQSH